MKPLTHQIHILKELKEKNKALIFIPSGAGKTHTIAFDVLQKKPKSVLYIVHKNEILYQTVGIFKQVCNIDDSNIGIINSEYKDFNKKYLFATNYSLYRTKNLVHLDRNIEYIIIDEFHHAAAPTFQKILDYFEPKYLYGLTATPERHDLKNIKDIIENNVVGNIDIYTGIERKILCPFHYRGFWDNIDYKNIRYNGYRYNIFDLDKVLLIEKRDLAVIKEYKKWVYPEKRLAIGFCNSIKHVERMVTKFNAAGFKAVGITYKEPLPKRRAILEGFRNRLYDILFTRDILNEGVDFPECEAILFLRPTYSKVVFLQQLGRGLRRRKGKQNVLILDFLGNYKNVDKIRQYLTEITKTKESVLNNNESRFKPTYKMNVPIVEFDSRVIDVMDRMAQERNSIYRHAAVLWNKKELIKRFELRNDGIPYTMWEMNSKYAGFAMAIKKFFGAGGYNQYLREATGKEGLVKKCIFCHKDFLAKWEGRNNNIYRQIGCSIKCTSIYRNLQRRTRKERTCKTCSKTYCLNFIHKDFQPEKRYYDYCSEECSQIGFEKKRKQYGKTSYIRHREKRKKNVSDYRDKNRDKVNEYNRSYYVKNKEKIIEQNRQRRRLRRNSEKQKQK